MNEVLKVNYETEEPTVSARDLYEKLGIEERFSKWFERMIGYGFEAEKEYSNPYQKERVQIEGGREVTRELEDYDLSLDMAKQICMIQRTEKGKICRQQFIDLEKAWNTPEQIFARALKFAERQINTLKDVNTQLLIKSETDKPKVIFADAVSVSKTCILIGDLAKLIKQNGVDIGQKRLFEWLRENGYLIKRQGYEYNSPTQRSMELGLFEVKETSITHSDGHVTVNKTTKVTGRGQQYFVNKFLDRKSKG